MLTTIQLVRHFLQRKPSRATHVPSLRSLRFLLFICLLLVSPPVRLPAAERPNVIFILADDLGWGDLGCYGNRQLRTPNLDRMAREGTLFTHFYVNASVCSPRNSYQRRYRQT